MFYHILHQNISLIEKINSFIQDYEFIENPLKMQFFPTGMILNYA